MLKAKVKGKDKSYIPKPKNPKPFAKEHPTKDDACHHCKEVGHCKRNCPAYLPELIMKKKQGLRGERKLKQGALYLRVGNGVRAQVEVIGISKNNVLYFNTIPSDGIYEIDMLNLVPNVNSIYNDSYFITFTDRGGKYISQEFKDYSKGCGIVQQLTPPYRPQHNEVSKRRNGTLLDMVQSMMNLTTLPLSFWDYALEIATRILNMVPTKKGCEALVKKDMLDKLQQRFVKCIFIRYPKETMGYYFYFPPKNKIVVARYAEFLEKNLLSQEVNGSAEELKEIQDKDTSPSENTSEIPMEVECFKPPQEEFVPIRDGGGCKAAWGGS
ncbi:retrotransposon protein, putative, ty1-copia subclass, partial [Tanacetum coccineum]